MKKPFDYYSNLHQRTAIAVAILILSLAANLTAVTPPQIPAPGTADALQTLDRLTSHAGSGQISWTGRLKTIVRLQAPFLQGDITRRIRQNLRLAQGDICFHFWLRLQTPGRQAVFHGLMPAKILRLICMAFSPSRRDRSTAAGRMATLPSPEADALLDTLVADPSRCVRLHAIRELTRIEPDTAGFTELLWLATCGKDAGRLQFNPGPRTWRSYRRLLSAVPYNPAPKPATRRTFHLVRCGSQLLDISDSGTVRHFRSTDARAAALALATWHSSAKHAVLQSLLPSLLRHADRRGSNYFYNWESWPALVLQRVDTANLLRVARPQTLGAILLGMITLPTVGHGHGISPLGRRYFRSDHTFPLFEALILLGQNPIKNGIVLTGRRNYYGRQVPAIVCAISHRAQQRAIALVKRQFAARQITAPTLARPPAAPANPLLSGNFVARRISLCTMEIGIIHWLSWTARLPVNQRHAMLAWGLTGANVNQAALAFSPSASGQMGAARVLAGLQSPPAAMILVRLLKSRRPAVQLTAISMIQLELTNPTCAAALVKFALHGNRASNGQPATAPPWTIRVAGKLMVIRQHRPHRRESRRQAFLLRRAALRILRKLPQPAGQLLVIQTACELANQNNGLLAISGWTRFRRRSAQSAWHLARHFNASPCAAPLLADIAYPRLRRLARHHADDRIIPLLLLCRLARCQPQQFGLSRLASPTGPGPFLWYATSRRQINAGILRMIKFWALRHVKPNAVPPPHVGPPA